MNKISLAACLLAFASVAVSTSCSTARGFGQDLQKVGNRIENDAESTGGTAPAPATTTPMAPAPTVPYAY